MKRTMHLSLSSSLLLVAASMGCTVDLVNTAHCSLNEGDAYCAELFPERPLCNSPLRTEECDIGALGLDVAKYGCVSEEELLCHDPCGNDPTCDPNEGGSSSSGGTEATTVEPSSSTAGETETASGETTTGAECAGDGECLDPARPFCVGEVCVGCSGVVEVTGDEACAGLDEGRPICAGDVCVQCTGERDEACGGETPVCDEEASTCVGCRFHEECQGVGLPACNVATGGCFAGDAVTEVNLTSVGVLQGAVDGVAPGAEHAIVVTGGNGSPQAVTIDGGKTIAIVSDSSTVRDINGNTGAPIISVSGAGSTVFLHRVRIDGSSGVGVSVGPAGTLYADSTLVSGNDGGGIALATGSSGFLRNCMVAGMNNSNALASSGSLDLLYTTVVGNFGASSTALSCSGGTAEVRNSILVSRSGDAVDCAGASISNTYEAEGGAYDEGWFDLDGGDLSLTVNGTDYSLFSQVAVWEYDDPPFDFEGDDRPSINGATDYVGADAVP